MRAYHYRCTRLRPGCRCGFTLVELLLVIAIIAVLTASLIWALSPTRQLGSTRDAKRQSDVNAILNAVYQYAVDQNVLPPGIPQSPEDAKEICRTGADAIDPIDCRADGAGTAVSLDAISGTYLVAIPRDPKEMDEAGTGTSYFIRRIQNGRITVTAPLAEVRAEISVTR